MILVASVELCLPALCFRCVAELDKSHISSIIECLSPSLSNLYDTDRIVITAFFGQVRSYKYIDNNRYREKICMAAKKICQLMMWWGECYC